MQSGAAFGVSGAKGDTKRDRNIVQILDPMRRDQGKMQAHTGIQFEQAALLLKFLFVNEISNFSEQPLLNVGFGDDFALVRIKNADLLSATNLKKEIVFRVQMKWRNRIGRG